MVTISDRLTALSTYRFFTMDSGGDVVADRSLECIDDDAARAMASTLSVGGATIEVWDVARYVGSSAALH